MKSIFNWKHCSKTKQIDLSKQEGPVQSVCVLNEHKKELTTKYLLFKNLLHESEIALRQ